ncbi:MmpS family transport accessory protein [Micromonospora sp. WMMC241]|uniref:MmpS family transport accessory protein n=1 Tax=Micromonospora sp. WMMC241 TaxID=3015159 RepID=UPI0022B6F879|nr:MmpS family transport accessory protein [Micromonospora sp. WMMC241]MCZ7435410.1 MmpS family transport accessory protein [Micromonospora sp. WMMC241]
MVGLVITLVAAVVLAVCGCVGLGALGGFVDGVASSGEPYDEPYIYGPDEPDLAPTSQAPATPVTTPSGGPGRFTVVYEVTGADQVYLQFYDADANFLQIEDVDAPWRLRFTANDRERVQIIASPSESGEVTCRITIDGKVVSRDSGEYGATCFGW